MREFEDVMAVTAAGGVALIGILLTVLLVRRRPAYRIEALFREGDFAAAGELAQEVGYPHRALDCFLAGGHLERAANCALRTGQSELAAKLYEKAGDAKKAAMLYEKIGEREKAAALLPDPETRNARTTTLTIELKAKVNEESQAGVRLSDLAPPLDILPREPSPVCLDVLKRVKQLEALPVATGRVLRLLDDPHASPKTIARELERDQQLATMVLRAANSAYYGASGQVRDVTAALVLIGFDAMKQLVVGRLSRQTLKKKNDRIQKILWKHALATAVGAQALAKASKGISPGHAFTSGLLHDIGKAVLYQAFPSEYPMVWVHSESDPRPSHEIEIERFGTDHAEVGAEMLRTWRLPAVYAVTTLAHHTPRAEAALPEEEARLCSSVVLASAIASWLGHGRFPARPIEEFPSETSMGEIDADKETIVQAAASIEKDLAGYEGIFG